MSKYDKPRMTLPEYDLFRAIKHQTNPRVARGRLPVHVPINSSAEFKRKVRELLQERGYYGIGVRSPDRPITGCEGPTITFTWHERPLAQNDSIWNKYGMVNKPMRTQRYLFAFYHTGPETRTKDVNTKPTMRVSSRAQSAVTWASALRAAGHHGVAVMGQERLLAIARGSTALLENISRITADHIRTWYSDGAFDKYLPENERSTTWKEQT